MDKAVEKSREMKNLEILFKLCRKYGVIELKHGDVHVNFGEDQPALQKPRKAVIRAQEKDAEHTFFQEQADRVRDEIEVSHIEDPLAYEEAIAKGLLTDEQSEPEANDETDN